MSEQIQDDGTYSAMPDAPDSLPETIEINGVSYRRQSGWVDEQVSRIKDYQRIAQRGGVSLRQAVCLHTGQVIPD